jgi:hypothetical protein
MDVAFGLTHFEEVIELFSSEWIVSILSKYLSFRLWLLDIPENVIGDGGEDLGLS